MKRSNWIGWLGGVTLGSLGAIVFGATRPEPIQGANADRFQEFIMVTGAAAMNPRAQSDALWLMDKKRNKLQATIIDRVQARIPGWTELDVATEFGLNPKQEHHFMMTTGSIAAGQAALYLVETVSGKMGVYTLGPSGNSDTSFVIRRHDISTFRPEAAVPEKLN